ncbi:RDD family protein [Xanthovirga aplysinae]|uniref:RDD family protein n=1 Tax=Xanthovirga aplysinae TaxID=2529853 RepID=UPI0012BD2080|nr:RDD family protein [Xanthovirga aplysinae]MTI29711.1 hypothetical protein [Xanthovirga aplysinae]
MENKPNHKTGIIFLILLFLGFIVMEGLFSYVVTPDTPSALIKLVIFIIPISLNFLGYKWAKWLLSIMLILYAVINFLAGFYEESRILYAVGIFNLYFGLIIHFSKDIKSIYRLKAVYDSKINQEGNISGLSYPSEESQPPFQYPYLIDRVKAASIDGLLSFLVFAILMLVVKDPVVGRPIALTVFVIFVLLYEPIMLTKFGATIGHQTVNIKVVSIKDHDQRISIFNGIIRIVIKAIFGWASFLTINFNSNHRAIHDFMSSSIVLKNQ